MSLNYEPSSEPGSNLLGVVSRGSAIIAELPRLRIADDLITYPQYSPVYGEVEREGLVASCLSLSLSLASLPLTGRKLLGVVSRCSAIIAVLLRLILLFFFTLKLSDKKVYEP